MNVSYEAAKINIIKGGESIWNKYCLKQEQILEVG
jgi:hypothetical protein